MRHVRGGVREVLYVAALSAARYYPALRAFQERRERKGTKAKVIRTAVAWQLLVRAHAILRDGRPWNPGHCATT